MVRDKIDSEAKSSQYFVFFCTLCTGYLCTYEKQSLSSNKMDIVFGYKYLKIATNSCKE